MKILYLGFNELHHTIDNVYINGLRENRVEVINYFFSDSGFSRYFKVLKCFWRNQKKIDAIIIGYASPQIVVWLRFFTFKKIIYNAISSEYERMIVSRQVAKSFSPKGFYYWLLDFLASHSASLIMLESQHQINYFSQLFWVSKQKCFLAWTGVNDKIFYYDKKLAKFSQFTVIFRGRLLPESGAEYVVEAAKKLEGQDVKIIMVSSGFALNKIKSLIDKLQPTNLELITDRLSDEQLRIIMQRSHLSLGQLSNHPRLGRTIPHKAYESLALALPYLTGRNLAVMELLKDGETCLTCNQADAASLAQKIVWAKNHSTELIQIGNNGYKLYFKKLTAQKLASQLLNQINKT